MRRDARPPWGGIDWTPPPLSTEQRERECGWLRARTYQDRRRLFEPRTRARGFLAATVDFRRHVDEAEVRDPEKRARFFALVDRVESIARGELLYDRIGGVDYLLRVSPGPEDPRLVVIAEAAALAKLSEEDLDAATVKIARMENATLGIAGRYLATLPAPSSPPTLRVVRPARRAPSRPRVNYDTTRLVEITAGLPESVSWSDRLRLCDELLAVPGDDEPVPDGGPPVAPISPEAMLLASAKIVAELDDALGLAAAEKARRLSTELPNCRGDEIKYLRRADDIDAEIVQPIRDARVAARAMLLRCAVKVCAFNSWPGGRESERHHRAMMLAEQVRRRVAVTSHDLELARAQLGHGSTNAI